jgi:hypothetical protein
MLQPKPLRLPSVGGRTMRCTPRSTSTSRIMPPPSSARTRSWLQFHPSKASGRGKHGSKSGRHSPLRAKNVLMGAVLAIAIGVPIVGFVGGHQDGAMDQRRMRRRAGRRRRTRISSTTAATPLRDSTLRVRCARDLQVASRGVTMRRMARASAPRICRCKIRPSSISQSPKRRARTCL